MPDIKQKLRDFNPWWGKDFHLEYKPRRIYASIQKFMNMPQIIALTGLRRVGKTTLLSKVIENEIQKGRNPQNIMYFLLDEFKETELSQIIMAYEELMEKNLRAGSFIIVFDEIQKVNDWENQLKTLYDTHKGRVKFLVSGSESLYIRKKTRETLAGRTFDFRVEPLTFQEFLDFKQKKFEPIGLHEKEIQKEFGEFITTQGFPELVEVKDRQTIHKYLKEGIIDRLIYHDIPAIFTIKEPAVLESIMNIFMEEPGQLLDLHTLSTQLGISRQTLSNYLTYLEESFLIRKLYNYSKNRRKIERKLKKYYPTIISADLAFKEDSHSKSKVLEWVLVNQLSAEFFWRDPYKNEVDIVLTEPAVIPIEVKLSETTSRGLEVFMQKHKVGKGYILTQKNEKNGETIEVVPAFKYLLKYNSLPKR